MPVDYQQLRSQITQLGNLAPQRAKQIVALQEKSLELLDRFADKSEWLIERVDKITKSHDPNLRCALPVKPLSSHDGRLDMTHPLPGLSEAPTILAADGSQIAPDRHAQVNFCLINLGAIKMSSTSNQAPEVIVETRLFHDDLLYTDYGIISEARLALERDLNERRMLLDLARESQKPVVSFTDGPMELWGSRDASDTASYQQALQEYLNVLEGLSQLRVTTAGYVDKPGANFVVRLLEIASIEDNKLDDVRRNYPLQGVTDFWIFQQLLQPMERSAVFAIQSRSAYSYSGELGLHFFYLNVGSTKSPWIARIEVPAWVAKSKLDLDRLHAVLIDQCRIMGSRSYPYLLHRAHETALVTYQEKEHVLEMIIRELYQHGVAPEGISNKLSAKKLAGRARYKG